MFQVVDLDKRKGRGVVSSVHLDRNTRILSVPCDISVLYTPFSQSHCAVCFRPAAATSGATEVGNVYRCQTCHQFLLCDSCNRDERWDTHHLPCQWFVSLPPEVQQGDTDYLRFMLEFCARIQGGDTRLLTSVSNLCTNDDSQSAETKQFCASYSKLIWNKFSSRGMLVDEDCLYKTLLRTKSNAIGFPFNNKETLGWALQEDICMMNHSCAPNCALTQSAEGLIELRALRIIPAGTELTISYVDLPSFPDLQTRARHLLQQYRFLCNCELCCSQREAAPSDKA